MDTMIFAMIIVLIVLFAFVIYMFLKISATEMFLTDVVELLARTFKEYYKTEDIEPVAVHWGIDLVWKPNQDSIDGKKGFITIYYGDDSGIDTPLIDAKDADILGGEIIKVVEKHLQDRDVGVRK